ncbi:sulfite exporter TauE/SafE family protein [Pokkaliibacter sp. CJK22405]|uniref:sulfite exporter TauE/SafE family protein n=1 Tax=Pokkaliibacter sp. CJK22405 TaxID=3384615 RepID=UPI00398556C3
MLVFLLYLVLGAVAGVLAGLFGIGGGMVIVPALIFAFGAQHVPTEVLTHLAIGTSLACIITTSISSIYTHNQKGGVLWSIFASCTLGILIGAMLGVQTAVMLPGPLLQKFIGVFAILVAIQMAFNLKPKAGRELPGKPGMVAAGGVIGWASAIFGIGGGTLTVPFLTWCNVRMQQAVGTSAALGLPIAISGALTNIVEGWNVEGLPEWSLGYVYLPAVLGIMIASTPFARVGAKLAHRLPAHVLKRAFAVLLVIVGVRFLVSG